MTAEKNEEKNTMRVSPKNRKPRESALLFLRFSDDSQIHGKVKLQKIILEVGLIMDLSKYRNKNALKN